MIIETPEITYNPAENLLPKPIDLIRSGRHDDLWQLCCGFIELSIDDFMAVQNSLLLEQIGLLKNSPLGRKLLGDVVPETVEQFRSLVRLTTYKDYCPDLLDKREDVLPAPPALWIESSGKGGEYPFKWIPISQRFWEEAGLNFCAGALFGSCEHKGEVNITEGFKFLHTSAPPPFLSDAVANNLCTNSGFSFIPSLSESSEIPFQERIEKGYNMALSEGMDGFFGLGGVLVAIGEKFKYRSGKTRYWNLVKKPRSLLRLTKGMIKAKRKRRHLMPKDLWSLKLIVSMGTDSLVYENKIRELWGRRPLNVYGNTESVIIATQTWDYSDMVFFPNLNYLEFIPETELNKWHRNESYQPKTLLLNEVQAGERYELVVTNFHGGALVRYRLGDMIKIVNTRNDRLNIGIPQMELEGRTDDLIDLGFIRLTEKIIWQAIENTGIRYKDWTAHKDNSANPKLKLYIELIEEGKHTASDVAQAIYMEIKKIHDGLYVYKDIEALEEWINFQPIDVTLLPKGIFSNFKQARQKQKATLDELKPPHINPSQIDLSLLSINDS